MRPRWRWRAASLAELKWGSENIVQKSSPEQLPRAVAKVVYLGLPKYTYSGSASAHRGAEPWNDLSPPQPTPPHQKTPPPQWPLASAQHHSVSRDVWGCTHSHRQSVDVAIYLIHTATLHPWYCWPTQGTRKDRSVHLAASLGCKTRWDAQPGHRQAGAS